jgi:hypothetical protein
MQLILTGASTMIRRTIIFATISLLFTAAHCQAQDKYTLKLKEPAQGDSYLFKHVDSIKTTSKTVDDKGNSRNPMTDTRGKSFTYEETVLEKPAGQATPVALRRAYQKAVVIWNDKSQTLPVEGKTVRITRKDDKYEYRLEGPGDLTPEDKAELNFDFNKRTFNFLDQDILPKEPVKVNESWSVDPKAILEGVSKDERKLFDLDNAKLTAKLVRVYENNKSQFGVVEFQFDLPLAVGVETGKGFKILGGRLIMQGTFDGCIDGSLFARTTKATMTYDVRGSQEDNLKQVLVVLSSTGTLEQSREDVAKK